MTKRSEAQNSASTENGRKGRGPVSPEGKAKSSQNARSHGLTGNADEPTTTEKTELTQLKRRLEARFNPENTLNARLIERVLSSTLRMNRARAIITQKVEKLASVDALLFDDEALTRLRYMQRVEAELCAMTGEKKINITLLHLFAENAGFEKVTRHYPSTKLDMLASYAQRFRGERDSALKKLEKLRNQQLIEEAS